MASRGVLQPPLIRAVLQNKLSEKPIKGVRTRSQDAPISHRISSLLHSPTWFVRSLLPDGNANLLSDETITKEKLHHLLRLSALPPPKNRDAEVKLLKTLQAQIHFVKEIQKVETIGVEPLRAIRDESTAAIEEDTITLEDLRPYLSLEEKVGRNGKIRRRKDVNDHGGENAHTWDPFGMSPDQSKKHGKHFVVKKPAKAVE